MRAYTRRALERSAELTRQNKLVEAVATAEAVFETADSDEHREIAAWLVDHADDYVRDPAGGE
ncbi:hypothetical protein QIS99_12725 [Streptomyces sp. B-S-A8]|uniref:Uncharacterized protein n=1 Tax=Streptomyces solicavernae TaxID=3043614 RepID=A0ABT6RRP1_9ACTN|nr:hypothetical protein [Streptomyces sp. B-S-A8]MDI3387055.1 hypothetical protein [Streptomyces sp. B-S-A8]